MDELDELELDYEEEEDEVLDNKYLTVGIAKKRYAINIEYVREIVTLPEVRDVPNGKTYERGIIKVRGELIHVIDMRKRLGLATLDEEDKELLELIKLRQREHVEWIEALVTSVKEEQEFTKATDPHLCAFGKWYDSFHTDDINLSLYLSYFDAPHKKIHALAKRVKDVQNTKGKKAALEIIEHARENEFTEMIALFNGIEQPVKEAHREVVVIIEKDGDLQGIAVDSVDKIINIPSDSIERKGVLKHNEFVRGVTDIEGESVVLLDYEKIIG